jgi:hypothetical protein
MNTVYNASPTVSRFMKSDHPFRILSGPLGTGKTVGLCMEIFKRCAEMPPWDNGIRRNKVIFIRNTNSQLRDTTLATWLSWFPPGICGDWKPSVMEYHLKVNDIEAIIMFRPLDSPDDVRRVLSLEVGIIALNECREVPASLLRDLRGRLRYPSPGQCPTAKKFMIGDTNPPEIESTWFKIMTGAPTVDDDPKTVFPCETYFFPSGLSPEAENIEHLPPNYYEDLARGQDSDWVNTYIHGNFSPSMSGTPVFGKIFRHDKHVHTPAVSADNRLPVIIGCDFGRNPAAIFMQMTQDGHINVVCEAVDFGVGFDSFILRHIKPILRTQFPDCPLVFIGDPSGVKRNDTDDGSCFKLLKDTFKSEGATVKGASTNFIVPRLQAVESALMYHPDGTPIMKFNPECRWITNALRSKYIYATKKEDQSQDQPDKQSKYSHIADALQYGCLFLMGGKYDPGYFRREDKVAQNPFDMIFPTTRTTSRYAGY